MPGSLLATLLAVSSADGKKATVPCSGSTIPSVRCMFKPLTISSAVTFCRSTGMSGSLMLNCQATVSPAVIVMSLSMGDFLQVICG
jgi:hypothetical protein